MTNASAQKLVTDLKVLMHDTEDLLQATAAQTGDKITALRSRVRQAADDIRPRLVRAEALLEENAKAAAQRADECVRASPWTAIGVAAGVAFLIGVLAGRR